LLKKSSLLLQAVVPIVIITLTACSGVTILEAEDEQPVESIAAPNPQAAPTPESDFDDPVVETSDWGDDLSQVDRQGSVEVKVSPVNLNNPGDTIDFEISLDTHSVDLNIDLVEIAMLMTDTGRFVLAEIWDAPSGGHHVEGILSFPANYKGEYLLADVNELQLIFSNLYGPERKFIWEKQ
jgi:hypothetical protein